MTEKYTLKRKSGEQIKLEGEIQKYETQKRIEGIISSDQKTTWLGYEINNKENLFSINEDELFQCASMIKPLIALAFFHQVNEEGIIYGSRSKKNMEAMVGESSNLATRWLTEQIGGITKVQYILKEHYGEIFKKTKITKDIPINGEVYQNKSCASDFLRFLSALWNDNLPHSHEIRRLMALPEKNCFTTYVEDISSDILVYNKTGSNGYVCGDMGILSPKSKDGKRYPYVMVGILEKEEKMDGKLNEWWDWLGTQRNVIRGVSAIVYNHMKEKYNFI